jgi:hypothetical protein
MQELRAGATAMLLQHEATFGAAVAKLWQIPSGFIKALPVMKSITLQRLQALQRHCRQENGHGPSLT